jgi:predicted nucleotidyltransferase
MTTETSFQSIQPEAFSPAAKRALEIFERDARLSYGEDLLKIVLFGGRARGDARPESDVDVAVVLKLIRDRRADRDRLADIAYEAIVETGVDLHAIPISQEEWEDQLAQARRGDG